MKGLKRILTIFILVFFLSPLMVNAKSYPIDQNMNMDIDDSLWYIFTRNNLDNNQELASLNISPSEMMAFFENNKAYLNGILLYKDTGETLQLFVRKVENTNTKEQIELTDQEFIDVVKLSLTNKNPTVLELYRTNGNRYVYTEYFDNSNFVMEYYIF